MVAFEGWSCLWGWLNNKRLSVSSTVPTVVCAGLPRRAALFVGRNNVTRSDKLVKFCHVPTKQDQPSKVPRKPHAPQIASLRPTPMTARLRGLISWAFRRFANYAKRRRVAARAALCCIFRRNAHPRSGVHSPDLRESLRQNVKGCQVTFT